MMEWLRQIRYMGLYAAYSTDGTDATLYLLCIFAGCVIAYLLGSINSAILLVRLKYHDDIRAHGSGNAGMTNVLRTYGKGAGIATLGFDMLKAVLSVCIAMLLAGQNGGYAAMVFCMLGHMFPIYFHFKGGKGVATAAGAILATAPLVVLALAVVFFALAFSTRIVSLSSVTVAALYPVFTFFYSGWMGYDVAFTTFCAAVMGGLVIWMHRANIKRLLNGTEYKFGQDKNKK